MPVPPEGRRAYHHGDLKRALVDAALSLVAEKGPRGFTLSEASRRAGVSLAAPYRHFADKAALLAAVAEQGFVELRLTLVDAGDETSDLRTRVVEMSRCYVQFAVSHPAHYEVMFGADIDKTQYPDLQLAGGTAFGVLLDVIGQCLESGVMRGDDPHFVAGPMWSVIHGVASLAIEGDLQSVGIDERPDDLVARAVDALLTGLS